jgi:MYXO-CTERM domain-containing protein
LSFSAVGGSGGYSFAIATNASGGGIDKSTGAYVAGNKGSVTDVVTVTDSSGTKASAQVAVGPEIAVAPVTATVTTGGSIPFSVSGGSGTGYAWTILANQSGGTIDPKTGVYTAGMVGGVIDTVVVSDSLGNSGTASVTVKGNPMGGGDAGVDSGTPMDGGGVPTDGGMHMDAAGGRDASMGMPDGGNPDSGFEVDASDLDGGVQIGTPSGNCGCAVVGSDDGTGTSGLGALGGLALGLAYTVRRRRKGA